MRLARAGTPVQQPKQRLLAVRVVWCGRGRTLYQDPLHDQLRELVLLRVEAASHVLAHQPLAQESLAHGSQAVAAHGLGHLALSSVAHAVRADDAAL